MTAVAEPPTRAPKVEFINREEAEHHAARAVTLLNASDESKVEAWFAMQAVADQVGPASNVGVRGITWVADMRPDRPNVLGKYTLRAACVDGHVSTTVKGPGSLIEARELIHLSKARAVWERKVRERGGLAHSMRHRGTERAMRQAISATQVGRDWIAARTDKSVGVILIRMVRVADKYGREGIYPPAALRAHDVFASFEDRAELVRQFPNSSAAQAKATSLRYGGIVPPSKSVSAISQGAVTSLALRSGVSLKEARTLLRAKADGRSRMKLIRAVNLAFEE